MSSLINDLVRTSKGHLSLSEIGRFVKAANLAQLSTANRVRCGAVAEFKGNILCGAFNTHRNIPRNVDFGYMTYHAEQNCLDMIPWEKRSKVSLYVARIGRLGDLRPSYPCHRCQAILVEAQIPQIIYYDGERLQKVKI